jgi:hypothetical protein
MPLGGVHALVWDDAEFIGHASVVQRRLLHSGRALRAGYVEAVGVRADPRRRGHAAALMDAVERVARGGYDLGALASSHSAVDFYAARGWRRWQGPKSALTPAGTQPTAATDDLVRRGQLDQPGRIVTVARRGSPRSTPPGRWPGYGAAWPVLAVGRTVVGAGQHGEHRRHLPAGRRSKADPVQMLGSDAAAPCWV